MWALIMLSIGLCDKIDKVPSYSNLFQTWVGYYYHLVNIISLNLPLSDYIKQAAYTLIKLTKLVHAIGQVSVALTKLDQMIIA